MGSREAQIVIRKGGGEEGGAKGRKRENGGETRATRANDK